MDFLRRLKTNLKLGRHGWRHLLPHPIFLIAFIILSVIVVWQVGLITDLVSTGLNVEPVKKTPTEISQGEVGQSQSEQPLEKPKTFWQKVNIFSDYKKEKAPVISESKPSPDRLQFSFTELFSGKGWKNEAQSSVYQDFYTTSISAPPAYDWRKMSISLPNDGSEVLAAKSSGRKVVILTSAGNVYYFDFSENLFASVGLVSVPTLTRSGFLDFDAETGRFIAALLGESEVHFSILSDEGGQIKKIAELVRPISSGASVADPSLLCLKGSCLWLHGSEFLSFKEDLRGGVKKEEILSNWFKDEGVISISMAKVPAGWLISKVQPGEGVRYNTDVYLWDGALSQAGENVFYSNYPGKARFGYDAANKKLFGIYAAYIGQAFEFSMPDKFTLVDPKNYSRFFNARILGGGVEGSVESFPEIFGQDGSWWIGSTPESLAPRFIKISPGGGAISLTQELVSGAKKLFLLPGFEGRVMYAIMVRGSGAEIYRLNDRGYEQREKYVWESSRINSGSLSISFGRITNGTGGGDVKYYLSNNGGSSWHPAKPGEFVKFDSGSSDFRWRAELSPSASQYSSPWLNMVTVEYYQ